MGLFKKDPVDVAVVEEKPKKKSKKSKPDEAAESGLTLEDVNIDGSYVDDDEVSVLNSDAKAKGLSRRERKALKRAQRDAEVKFESYPHLVDLKPYEKYVFHSDYFQVDGRFCSILSFFHTEGASDNYGAFWGVNKIPSGLDHDVEVILFEQNRKMTEGWLSDRQKTSESVAKMNENEQVKTGSNSSKANAARRSMDMMEISKELNDGAAYLQIQFRLMVIAPTLKKLDQALAKIARLYIDRFATLSAAPYFGEQKQELSKLFMKNQNKQGHGFYMTSCEYAGAYSLVTHGLEDSSGEYVGQMVGDVNNAAVLFDVDNYRRRVVIADESYDDHYADRVHVSALWGSKISQSALLANHRVVHLILDGTDLDLIGPKFSTLTFKLDLNKGDVNMFEMFGEREDQLAIFPSQMQKLILMAEQAYECTPQDRAVIRGSLEEVATKFYVDNRMWYVNAKENLDKLRIVGIPHDQVPKLEMFCTYLDTAYKAIVNKTARDPEKLHALAVLSLTFKNLRDNNGDLFNTTTTSVIDGAATGQRVIYDFSRLLQRGIGVAMAQLVNIIGFAVNTMGKNDVVIIHGAEKIDSGIKKYLDMQFDKLFDAGGRVAYLYNSVDKMLADSAFCKFDRADYMIFGNMTEGQAGDYQKAVNQDIPADLVRLITNRSESINYIRRGFDNIVFTRDLTLCAPGRTNTKGGHR